MKNVTFRDSVPCAYITKGKQRIKQFDKSVYLNNGDEFEIELFNPTSNKVLAAIELNGKSLFSGIVLRPGERVFLERYLDSARKFLFETYTVNGNNDEVQRAIANNGNVVVKFYGEYINMWPTIDYNIPTINWGYNSTGGSGYLNTKTNIGASAGGGTTNSSNTFSSTPTGDVSAYYNSNLSDNMASFDSVSFACCSGSLEPKAKSFTKRLEKNESKIETGRIEKGSHSNQTFQYDNTVFNTYWSWMSEWKILPLSQKPRTAQEINQLVCSNCGRPKKKDSYKYCPYCGINNWRFKE